MLAVILALVSAIGYGASDFAAGLASRTASVIQVTLLACLAATAAMLAVLPLAAPLGAVGTAGFSVLAGLLWGERPSVLALAGIALACPPSSGSRSARAATNQPGKPAARPGRPREWQRA